MARQLNPLRAEIFQKRPVSYYWSIDQSEWANDLIFRQAADLRWLYPRLVHHGMTAFSSSDVMLFLGRRISLSGDLPKSFSGGACATSNTARKGCASSMA
jgi:hypothetical protein